MSKKRSLPDALYALLESSVVQTLHTICGPEACLVGGVLRDALLSRTAADVDVVVSGGGHRLAERLAAALEARLVHLGGERFASYRLVFGGRVVDLWDREGHSLEDDLRRRDFTINSIALELGSEHLMDPFEGIRDIDERRLRATTDKSFLEDPLRVLRLVRFAADLQFDIEPETLGLARRSVADIPEVAIERIRAEVVALIRHPRRVEAVRLLSRLSIYPSLWWATDHPLAEGNFARPLDQFEEWSEEIRRSTEKSVSGVDPYLTGMTLLYIAANAVRSDDTSPSRVADAVRESRLLTRREKSVVERLAGLVDPEGVPELPSEARWFLHQWGDRWPDAVAVWGLASATALGPAERRLRLHQLSRLARDHGPAIFEPAPLLSGDEVVELLSIDPGPEVGRLLNALRRRQIEGRISTRGEALVFVADWRVGGEN